MREFLNWSAPFLPAVSAWLLRTCGDADPDGRDADLGDFVVVVRGRAAGRRLLALLAGDAQRAGRILVPPAFATMGNLHDALFESGEATAGPLHRRLAWMAAIERTDAETIASVWKTRGAGGLNVRGLAAVLDRTWQELGMSGADFREAFELMERVSPDTAAFESERWRALAVIADAYHGVLADWGMCDSSALRRRLARGGTPKAGVRVVLAGIVELAPALVQLLRRLETEPVALVHAPETLAKGFDEWGRLEPAFWADHPCKFASGEIHVVRGAREQAERCAEIIRAWESSGLDRSSIAIAAPEQESIPAILDGLDDAAIPARAAQGKSAARTAVLELLSAMAEYLDRDAGKPPLYSATARLLRHPDLAPIIGNSINSLDQCFEQHLPWRLGPFLADEIDGARRLQAMVDEVGVASGAGSFSDGVTAFLLRVYGRHRLNRNGPEGRPVVHALEAIAAALDEIKALPASVPRQRGNADLLRLVIEIAGSVEIPEPELPDAVEIMGWLEAATDDSAGLIITSVFEGALPEGAATDPVLSDPLRKHLGLPNRSSRYARDQYTLWSVTVSRGGSGRIALIAPRRDAAGVPVRPSRLLIAAHESGELAARLLRLTSAPGASQKVIRPGPGFLPPGAEPGHARAFRVFPVTGFRTYLASPRLFYLKHVLGLRDRSDLSDEMDGGMFGTEVHAVLNAFGVQTLGRAMSMPAEAIFEALRELLDARIGSQFGRDALPSVRCQAEALRERLRGFAEHQAALFEQGWRIMYVETRDALESPFPVAGAPGDVSLRGKIDRIDMHPDLGWRVVDYKTSAVAQKPLTAHWSERGQKWKDLQLPLYLSLLPAVGALDGRTVDPDSTDLVYFNLPPDPSDAGITDPFPRERCIEAAEKAGEIVRAVRAGEGFDEIGIVHEREDPAFLALCGLNGFPVIGGEE